MKPGNPGLTVIGTILAGSIALGISTERQTASQPRPEFEAVVIRQSAPNAKGSSAGLLPGGKIGARNEPLKYFVTVAYGVTDPEVFGDPDLLESRYDLNAEAGHPVDGAQISLMLRAALEDQLGLRVHRETRELALFGQEARTELAACLKGASPACLFVPVGE